MSMHKIPLTTIEEAGLRAHGLDIGTPSQLSDAFRQGVRFASAQSPSQGGEAVAWHTDDHLTDKSATTYDREVAERWRAKGWPVAPLYTQPADQVADDLTMVKASRELLQDLRDLAFDQVEHHRAAMGAYKQTRQSAMDSVLAQADALLGVKS